MPVIEHWVVEVVASSGLPAQWPLGDSDNYTDALMERLVLLSELDASLMGDWSDYEAMNDWVLRQAERVCVALLDGPGAYDRRARREPHLYPSDYREAQMGERTIRLMQFGGTFARKARHLPNAS
jgi:hypothetical protein